MPYDRIDLVLRDWKDEQPDLETEALGIVLRVQAVAKLMAEGLTETLNELDLERWEYDVLSALRRQGPPFELSASEITEAAMISAGAGTNRIDRLLARRFVTRVEDPEDRRRVLVKLTLKGREMIDRASITRFAAANHALEGLSPAKMKQLGKLMRELLEINER